MPAVVDTGISGDGSATFAFSDVAYLVCHLATLGGEVRELEAGAPDHILRAGWVSLGDNLSVIGATARDYWRLPIFLDFVDTFWTPVPSSFGSTPLTLAASRIRWHLSYGTIGHLYVFAV